MKIKSFILVRLVILILKKLNNKFKKFDKTRGFQSSFYFAQEEVYR